MFPIDWSVAESPRGDADRAILRHNQTAIVANGIVIPTAGRILVAGLLLTWFLSELTSPAFVAGPLVLILCGVAARAAAVEQRMS